MRESERVRERDRERESLAIAAKVGDSALRQKTMGRILYKKREKKTFESTCVCLCYALVVVCVWLSWWVDGGGGAYVLG